MSPWKWGHFPRRNVNLCSGFKLIDVRFELVCKRSSLAEWIIGKTSFLGLNLCLYNVRQFSKFCNNVPICFWKESDFFLHKYMRLFLGILLLFEKQFLPQICHQKQLNKWPPPPHSPLDEISKILAIMAIPVISHFFIWLVHWIWPPCLMFWCMSPSAKSNLINCFLLLKMININLAEVISYLSLGYYLQLNALFSFIWSKCFFIECSLIDFNFKPRFPLKWQIRQDRRYTVDPMTHLKDYNPTQISCAVLIRARKWWDA